MQASAYPQRKDAMAQHGPGDTQIYGMARPAKSWHRTAQKILAQKIMARHGATKNHNTVFSMKLCVVKEVRDFPKIQILSNSNRPCLGKPCTNQVTKPKISLFSIATI